MHVVLIMADDIDCSDDCLDDDCLDTEEEGSPQDEDDDSVKVKGGKFRFSKAQNLCLTAYFNSGMRGTGKKFYSLILKAAADTKLTTDQIKVSKVTNFRIVRTNTVLVITRFSKST